MDSSKLNENRDARPTVTIVGSGICGMFTGLALDRRGFNVTIIERDTPPPDCSANEAFFPGKEEEWRSFVTLTPFWD